MCSKPWFDILQEKTPCWFFDSQATKSEVCSIVWSWLVPCFRWLELNSENICRSRFHSHGLCFLLPGILETPAFVASSIQRTMICRCQFVTKVNVQKPECFRWFVLLSQGFGLNPRTNVITQDQVFFSSKFWMSCKIHLPALNDLMYLLW